MKGGTQAGHIFYVKYHVPIADEQQARDEAESLVAIINDTRGIGGDNGINGFAEVESVRHVVFDYDEHGDIIGW